MEDKLVQQSVSQILQSIWENEFLRNNYGYRPNKSAHQAIHSLTLNLQFKGYGYIVEADIKGFFDNMSHQWLIRMLNLKIKDKAILNLINQWLKAKVQLPNGQKIKPASGSSQGGIISPILANIYLHYALDLWFECYWGKDHQGEPRLKRVTSRKKHKLMLSTLYQWIKQNRSKRLNILMPKLKRKLVGIQNYFGLPDNSKSISRIYNFVLHSLYKWLNRRSQRHSFNWRGFKDMLG